VIRFSRAIKHRKEIRFSGAIKLTRERNVEKM
jgi:hypothetical protein